MRSNFYLKLSLLFLDLAVAVFLSRLLLSSVPLSGFIFCVLLTPTLYVAGSYDFLHERTFFKIVRILLPPVFFSIFFEFIFQMTSLSLVDTKIAQQFLTLIFLLVVILSLLRFALNKVIFGSDKKIVFFTKNENMQELTGRLKLEDSNYRRYLFVQNLRELSELIEQQKIVALVLAITKADTLNDTDLLHKLLELRVQKIQVMSLHEFYEKKFLKVPLLFLGLEQFVLERGIGRVVDVEFLRLKRVFDLLAVTVLLPFLLPLFILGCLLVILQRDGAVFYSQTRVGYLGRFFKIYKLRTMRIDAEKNGPQWCSRDDQRISKFGHFLRKTRIDEVPQLYNVLKGEMSLVGPRPERPEFTEVLEKKIPFYALRFHMPPGLTGPAQVFSSYGSSIEDAARKLEYELHYLKHSSIFYDVKILLRTVRVVLSRLGR